MLRKKLWLVVGIFLSLSLLISGCGDVNVSTLQPAGEVAQAQYDLMILSTLIMVLVIVVVSVLFIVAIIKFRLKKGQENEIPEQVEGNHKLEFLWTAIPIVLLIILAVPTLILTFQLADTKAIQQEDRDAVVVNVRANLFWWEFEYPDLGIVTSQELVVPTDERVYFVLTASDVKHSFWIPAAGGKMDTNVEGELEFYLQFDRTKAEEAGNVFYGKCAELCGPSHALMNFRVRAVPRGEFNAWVVNMKNATESTLTSDAEAGREIFNQSCIGCHAVSVSAPGGIAVGPNLAGFGDRLLVAGVMENTTENVTNWIKDPGKYKPGNKMTGAYSLTDDEINKVVQYIESLKIK